MSLATPALKQKITSVLKRQGFGVKPSGLFALKDKSREAKRKAHDLAKAERLAHNERFIVKNAEFIKSFLIDGKELDVKKIEPVIIEVKSNTKEETLFRWWNLVWWSLPYERGYGRQMRFIIWDKYHRAPLGIIGLQSPILSWNVRDTYLGIPAETRDFWVNQSLGAQRLGALPPYNYILGGKLVALLMTADVIRKKFQKKYTGRETLLKKRKLPAHLLFITTTGAYGKSSIYTRLKFKDEQVVKFIGYSQGSGTFHIPNTLYEDLVDYLRKEGYNVRRGYGSGPSRKLRLIDQALQALDFRSGAKHGVQRAVYLFPLVKNLEEVIKEDKKPVWMHRAVHGLTDYWKERWGIPRVARNKEYLEFLSEVFLKRMLRELEHYKYICPAA